MQEKKIVFFEEGTKDMRALLGGKGAGLAEMTRVGLPVPPGFTVTTAACMEYFARGALADDISLGLERAMARLQEQTGKAFGNPTNPLLVSVRSGAAFSMPGMMDTVLNLGLNNEVVHGLSQLTSPVFALDCYRRFIEKYAEIVLKVPHHHFADCLEERKRQARAFHDHELGSEHLSRLIEQYREIVARFSVRPFPESPWEQLVGAVQAVFDSWQNSRAKVYRKLHGISDAAGTAVNVQAMVFGNLGSTSGTGVCFTRNPSTGAKGLFGEYLASAQGEDVVSGTRTPERVSVMGDFLPEAYGQLLRVASQLETHYRDMQDIEFTVERGKLYLLQTRAGKRSAAAAVRIAVEMLAEGLITTPEALLRVTPEQIELMLHRAVDYKQPLTELTRGLPASPGAATGAIVFDNEGALRLTKAQRKTILLRPETSPDDIQGIIASEGIITSRGGMTSHAAVVARGMGKPCVCGAESVRIDLATRTARIGEHSFVEGDIISLDGQNGKVFLGAVPLVEPEPGREFAHLLSMADDAARLAVRANADNPHDAALAKSFGAKGIGLCRTEHMFMETERLPIMQAMIMAEHEEDRQFALQKLLPMQRSDFTGILKAMNGFPVTIRLLDPPLHEFLPAQHELEAEIAKATTHAARVKAERALRVVEQLHESNPMLGHRGCRLGITAPSVYAMQVEAIADAVFDLLSEGYDPRPEIMIPLVGHHRELIITRRLVESTWGMVEKRRGQRLTVPIGTMIEIPRACLVAGELAKHADFFSFGTNDLTQTTFGFSRDDVEGKFLPAYIAQDILTHNPFAVLDREGVGRLMRLAMTEGRAAKPSLKIGICGEHGGEANSIAFCSELGLDYVSCSPYRVPVARFAAGRALYLGEEQADK
ncbi:MAG: Pyruvate, phosphate dikinase [Firmicutes bacterium]|nr:Pyruvate, phosphate dikinase [candidate division NPL-UPA2 bacterium]MBT9156716.1 Pyruvate, phosphate dikinase [candidate division NPL-UPA2 bacterium]